jgi:DNA-binding transcriptional regulator YdaS (Cro superfamily)
MKAGMSQYRERKREHHILGAPTTIAPEGWATPGEVADLNRYMTHFTCTYKNMARMLDINPQRLANYLKGRTPMPRRRLLAMQRMCMHMVKTGALICAQMEQSAARHQLALVDSVNTETDE